MSKLQSNIIKSDCSVLFFRSLISYSDGCGGQNKNHTFPFLLYRPLQARSVRVSRTQVHGTWIFVPWNDRDFALIEKRKKSSMVLLLEDWAKVIAGANLRNPFKVTKMKQEDCKSWKIAPWPQVLPPEERYWRKHCGIPADPQIQHWLGIRTWS